MSMSGIPLQWSMLGGIFASMSDSPITDDVSELGDIVRKNFKIDAIYRAFDAYNRSWVTECAADIIASGSPVLCALLAGAELQQANIYHQYGNVLAYLVVYGTADQLWQGLQWLPEQWPARLYPDLFIFAFNQLLVYVKEAASIRLLVPTINQEDALVSATNRFVSALLQADQRYYDEFFSPDTAVIASLIRKNDWPVYGPVCEALWSLAWHGDAVAQNAIKAVPGILRAALAANQASFLYKVSRESNSGLSPDCELNVNAAVSALQAGTATALTAEYILTRRLLSVDQLIGTPCYLYALAASNGPLISLYDEYRIPLFPSPTSLDAKERWMSIHNVKMLMLEVANTSTVEVFLSTSAFRSTLGQDYASIVSLLRERAEQHPHEQLSLVTSYVISIPYANLVAGGVNLDALRADAFKHDDLVLLEYLDSNSPMPQSPVSPVIMEMEEAKEVRKPVSQKGRHAESKTESQQNFCIADRVKRRKDRLSDGIGATGGSKRPRRRSRSTGGSRRHFDL